MNTKLTAAFVSSLLAIVAPLGALAQTFYNHNPGSQFGPANWSQLGFPTNATCGGNFPGGVVGEVGKKQTPINIVTAAAAPITLPALAFLYDTLPAPVKVETNDHTVEVPYPGASVLKVGNDAYTLLQFHFHTRSEHLVDGAYYAAELHLVHRNSLGDLAVVGVLLDTRLPPNPAIEAVLEAAKPFPYPYTPGPTVIEGDMEVALNAKDVLPVQTGYYTYSGSLTTPPCTEGVRWFVLKTPVGISPEKITKLQDIVASFPGNQIGGTYYENYRPEQKVGSRAVFQSNK